MYSFWYNSSGPVRIELLHRGLWIFFCETYIDQGDDSYADCKTTEGPISFAPEPPTTTPPPPTVRSPILGGAIEQSPSSNTPPPPSTLQTSCPDGSAPDANGNCLPSINQNPQPPVSSTSDNLAGLKGESTSNNNNNNNAQSEHHHHSKGSNLGPIGGEGSAVKKDSGGNNDNSPTPPACPDKGPIPPNCTLKPKF